MSIALIGNVELERELESVRSTTRNPMAGVFGPNSMMWRILRENLIFLGAGRALLLQLAHPLIARAIREHSRVLTDPLDRSRQTFNIMFTIVFGTLEQALSAARRLHRRHTRVQGFLPTEIGPFAQGSHYCANEVSALCWVHATLMDTALATHQIVFPGTTEHERERYYSESKVLAGLFGIPQDRLPQTWSAFADYMAMLSGSNTLTVGTDAHLLAKQVLNGGAIWLRAPGWYRAVTARLLPPQLRDSFGLPYGTAEQRTAEKAINWIRRTYPVLPERIRYVGPYQEANARLEGRRLDAFTRMANRLSIGQPRLDGAPGLRSRYRRSVAANIAGSRRSCGGGCPSPSAEWNRREAP